MNNVSPPVTVFATPPSSYYVQRWTIANFRRWTIGREFGGISRHGMSGAEEEAVVCLYVKQLELLAQVLANLLQLSAQLLDVLLEALFELPEANLRLHASTHQVADMLY